MEIIIIGGGITGLSAAYRLIEANRTDLNVTLLEASSQFGGTIKTIERDGFLIELGPDSFLATKPWLTNLTERLNIKHRILPTNDAFRRSHIVHNGALKPLPEGFLMMAPTKFLPLVTTDLFTWTGKCRMAMDLFLPRGKAVSDESLGAFVRRRLGQEVLERVVQPLIGGIYTGDPDDLSLKAILPRFLDMEARDRSIIKAMWKQKRVATKKRKKGQEDSGARYSDLVSFDHGMQTIIDTLLAHIPDHILVPNSPVQALQRVEDQWQVRTSDDQSYSADAVIMALPSAQAAAMLSGLDTTVSDELNAIPHASSAIMNLAFNRSDIPHPLDGFGFVVPAIEKRKIIACSFSSVKFSNRAPGQKVLLRVFIGGAMHHELFKLSDLEMEQAVYGELRDLMGIEAQPLFKILSRYAHAMPQYLLGHVDRVVRIKKLVNTWPNLALAGNAFSGVGLPDCVHSGEEAAEKILNEL